MQGVGGGGGWWLRRDDLLGWKMTRVHARPHSDPSIQPGQLGRY